MSKFFPWRLFWKFLAYVLSAFGALGAFVFLSLGEISAWPVVVTYAALSILFAIWISYRFTSPLKRVLYKTMRIANKKDMTNPEGDRDEELFEDEPGEYQEIELALERIRKKLKKRKAQLAKEREEIQALIGSMDDAMVSFTVDERLNFYNSRFVAQFFPRDQFSGPLTLAQVFREPEVLSLFRRSLQTGEAGFQQLVLQPKDENSPRYYSVTVSPLREEKTSVAYGAIALFHDITDIKQAEKIRIEFVENASHELRTPLTSIKGFVATLKEDVQNKRLDQLDYFLDVISKSVDRLSELVNDMLTLSALDSSLPLKKKESDTQVVTHEVIESMATLAKEKNINIELESLVPTVWADEAKLHQVLQNLLGNAIKYIPENGKIRVVWKKEGDFVTLRVIDDGPGIAEEHLPRLFERFYRIDKGRSRDAGGTGLGLAIVKHIMVSHGGTIQAKSKPGAGAEFICHFPSS